MKEYEDLLKRSIELKNAQNSVNCMEIGPNERQIIEKLRDEHYITNVRFIGMRAVGFDLTYDGLHYFDE